METGPSHGTYAILGLTSGSGDAPCPVGNGSTSDFLHQRSRILHFIYLRGRETETEKEICLLVHSPNVHKSQGYTKAEAGWEPGAHLGLPHGRQGPSSRGVQQQQAGQQGCGHVH